MQDVFSSSGFNELSEDALAAILTSDKLMMDETHILSNVTEWITVNSVRSKQKVLCNYLLVES